MAPPLAPAAGATSSAASGKALVKCMLMIAGGKLVASGEHVGRRREEEAMCNLQEPIMKDGQVESDAVSKQRSGQEAGILSGRREMPAEEGGRIERMRVGKSICHSAVVPVRENVSAGLQRWGIVKDER
jgi:hypothetical protein